MTEHTISRPDPSEYLEYFEPFISKFTPEDFWAEFQSQPNELTKLLQNLPSGEEEKLHTPYTWTLKQVVGHLIDTERILSTRLLRIAVGDSSPNPDFQQDNYVAGMDYQSASISGLVEEFAALRKSNALLIGRLNPNQFSHTGIIAGHPVSARTLPFLMGGHFNHHLEIMKKRLGKS